VSATTAGVVVAIGLDDVVLNQGVLSPAIDRKVAVTTGVEATAVADGSATVSFGLLTGSAAVPGASRVPSFSADKVADIGPLYGVGSCIAVGVGNIAAAIRPERIVVAVVVAGGARSGALEKGSLADRSLGDLVSWSSECSESSREGEKDGREGNHFDCECRVGVVEEYLVKGRCAALYPSSILVGRAIPGIP
jgi:hypothetical protein